MIEPNSKFESVVHIYSSLNTRLVFSKTPEQKVDKLSFSPSLNVISRVSINLFLASPGHEGIWDLYSKVLIEPFSTNSVNLSSK